MKIYVAGQITGLKNHEEKFKEAVRELRSLGHDVMYPTVLPPGFEHNEYMHICYSMIDVCEAVYFLNNWKQSKGAKLEREYAVRAGKSTHYQEAHGAIV